MFEYPDFIVLTAFWNVLPVVWPVEEIDSIITLAKSSDKPAFIDIHTVIGHGYAPVENSASVHGSPLKEEQIEEAKSSVNYPTTPFEIPSQILSDWNETGHKFDNDAKLWNEKVEK